MDGATVRLVIGGLVLICCICVVGLVVMAATGRDSPATMGALALIGSNVSGALVGIIVNVSRPTQPPSGPPVWP